MTDAATTGRGFLDPGPKLLRSLPRDLDLQRVGPLLLLGGVVEIRPRGGAGVAAGDGGHQVELQRRPSASGPASASSRSPRGRGSRSSRSCRPSSSSSSWSGRASRPAGRPRMATVIGWPSSVVLVSSAVRATVSPALTLLLGQARSSAARGSRRRWPACGCGS